MASPSPTVLRSVRTSDFFQDSLIQNAPLLAPLHRAGRFSKSVTRSGGAKPVIRTRCDRWGSARFAAHLPLDAPNSNTLVVGHVGIPCAPSTRVPRTNSPREPRPIVLQYGWPIPDTSYAQPLPPCLARAVSASTASSSGTFCAPCSTRRPNTVRSSTVRM